jgi:hypothetical protein
VGAICHKWPNTFECLNDIGLPSDIIDWLAKLYPSCPKDSYSKAQVIKLWLEILALYPLAQHAAGLGAQQENFLERYYKCSPEREALDQNSEISASQQLLFKAVLEKLVTITADNWPGVIEASKAA